MNKLILLGLITLFGLAACSFTNKAKDSENPGPIKNTEAVDGKQPVLVELFTSEG